MGVAEHRRVGRLLGRPGRYDRTRSAVKTIALGPTGRARRALEPPARASPPAMDEQPELPLPPPPLRPDQPYLPARMVNEFQYCPRLAYLEWVQGEWAESADTVEGRAVHRRVDASSGELPEPDAIGD